MARELPIFPLPIVLFPGAPQPLHIFEPRYRQLLQDCLAGDQRFGIAYVAPDPSPGADPVPLPGDVGCVALIRSNQPLPDGRANIETVAGVLSCCSLGTRAPIPTPLPKSRDLAPTPTIPL